MACDVWSEKNGGAKGGGGHQVRQCLDPPLDSAVDRLEGASLKTIDVGHGDR